MCIHHSHRPICTIYMQKYLSHMHTIWKKITLRTSAEYWKILIIEESKT